MTNNSPLIEMENVSRVYQMGRVQVPALHGVNLRIQRGEFTAIVGPSGSGKTTLLNVIGCLDLPTEGTYRLQGRDVTTLSDAQLSRLRGAGVGFVFQDYSLLRRFSALRNVELPRYYARGRGDRARALGLLEQVGLAERAKHRPTELSGGEQQRVAVARALMNEPFLILADEPTGNLDSASGQELMALLRRLNEEQGLTLLIVTHDPSISAQARRIIRMRDGQVVADEAQG
ncbi:MAG TPA: ABC transporter ATP-binding protein [Anaerolineae bacterium]|nr:ABC transporter ATP-binding protein [Anaerolineae bacterium]HOQ99552.1 ABC transporter ATP-binding protein [Anaerolineae bacterium]HPL27359.1 ABC transporter ATP-binding protein [Anaerolineae bacterium]